jgi:hypothetical protein
MLGLSLLASHTQIPTTNEQILKEEVHFYNSMITSQ